MKLSEKINIACEKGLYPIISVDTRKIIVSPHKDDEGNWRDSNFYESVSVCKNFLGVCGGYAKPIWDKKERESGAELIGYYTPEVIPYKVGDMVDINSDLFDKCYHGGSFEKRENLKIEDVFDSPDGLVYNEDGNQTLIAHKFLIPHFPEKIKEVTMKEIEEKFGEKVKIIK